MSIQDIAQLINSGGNVALCMACVFIYRASERLARIEKALGIKLDGEKDA